MAHPMSSIGLIAIFLIAPLVVSATQYNVLNYGAKADGTTDSTKAFLAAWTQVCASTKPATMYIPRGRFLLGSLQFQGPCKNSATIVRIAGTLVAPSDYTAIGSAGNWIEFSHVDGVTVSGGILDGQGISLWACKASGKNCPTGATSLGFENSNNIVVSGLTSLNSQLFHISIYGCNNALVKDVKLSASGNSPNTDGIHVQLSTGVTILQSKIKTGDDCISVGPGSSNLWIESIACGPGHGISIGSLGWDAQEPGVQNVTVKTVAFIGTQNGFRIKSWARQSNGFAKDILFQHATMINVQNPIVIDQNYCPNNINCPKQSAGVKISDVTYQDIHGTSATEVGVKFDCSKKYPCTGIKLQDVKLTYKNQLATASCNNADGTATGLVQPAACF